jgi:hypothetical protein
VKENERERKIKNEEIGKGTGTRKTKAKRDVRRKYGHTVQ